MKSSIFGIRRSVLVDHSKSTDVLEEHIASIFRVEMYAKQETSIGSRGLHGDISQKTEHFIEISV
jgi:hypothetical protein